jgi:predicted Zn finger-like uncharacterized protein
MGTVMAEGFQVACPSCEARLKLQDASAGGKRIRCPKCETAFIVPALTSAPATRSSSVSTPARKPSAPARLAATASKAKARPPAELDDFLGGLNSLDEFEDEAPRAPAPPKRAAAPKAKPKAREFEETVPGSDKRGRGKRKGNDFLSSLGILGWIAGGCVGGLVGGGIWAAIGHFTGVEIGWIAWGVGFVVGLGVRIGAGENYGIAPGGTAAGIAIATILIAKLFVANSQVEHMKVLLSDVKGQEQIVMHSLAMDVVGEYEAQGKQLVWPRRGYGKYKETMSAETAEEPEDFPPEVWTEAETRWAAIPEDQKKATLEIASIGGNAMLEVAGFSAVVEIWKDNLKRPVNILFFILAAVSAFKLGYGSDLE